jgi:hypothetical protein
VITGCKRNQDEGANPEIAPSGADELRPSSFGLQAWDDELLLIQPYPTGRILVDRQPKPLEHGISWGIQNVPLHGVLERIVQNQADMVKLDNSAKRFADAREQGVQIRPASNRSGERQNSFIDIARGCSTGADHKRCPPWVSSAEYNCDLVSLAFHGPPHPMTGANLGLPGAIYEGAVYMTARRAPI